MDAKSKSKSTQTESEQSESKKTKRFTVKTSVKVGGAEPPDGGTGWPWPNHNETLL